MPCNCNSASSPSPAYGESIVTSQAYGSGGFTAARMPAFPQDFLASLAEEQRQSGDLLDLLLKPDLPRTDVGVPPSVATIESQYWFLTALRQQLVLLR